MATRLLVLTDTHTHTGRDSIYPMTRHVALNAAVTGVCVCDRALDANAWFFERCDPGGDGFAVKQADAGWSFESSAEYPLQILHREAVDAVWLRLDHPVKDDFLRYVRAFFEKKTVLNDPIGLIRTGSKAFLVELSAQLGPYMPEIALCRTVEDVLAFRVRHPDIVIKKTHSFGGQGVARIRTAAASDLADEEDIRAFLGDGAVLAMPYLDHPDQSDNRLIVMNGRLVGAIQRKAAPGGWLCNITAGGSSLPAEPDAREHEIVRRVDPFMRRNGIVLYGIDTLMNGAGERVASEVNTLNIGTIYYLEKLTGRPLTKIVADGMVQALFET